MIPRIIHQMWIGELPEPSLLMSTWREKHSDSNITYILWNEKEFERRNMKFRCQTQIDEIKEICGKCDIMRWEILHEYGGIFIDADSVCYEPIHSFFKIESAFACFENENIRKGLLSNSTMGFCKNHPLCRDIIDWILDPVQSQQMIRNYRAWVSVGPARLTDMYNKKKKEYNMTILPSYLFFPIHHTEIEYFGHRKVFANHLWGSSNNNYHTLNTSIVAPKPTLWCSVILYRDRDQDQNESSIMECLQSILDQVGFFGIEVVYVANQKKKDYNNNEKIRRELKQFIQRSRFITLLYIEKYDNNIDNDNDNQKEMAICSHDIVFMMNVAYRMSTDRMNRQLEYMNHNKDACLCYGNIFHKEKDKEKDKEKEKKTTLCIRKNATDNKHDVMNRFLCYSFR
jgi:hypothetical protein